MSKSSRGIPGQGLMSRLFTRVASRPTIGTSPAFFARFGLEDPWAFSGFGGGPSDSSDPFVFLSAADYYGHMDRLRARQRLMERFRAMEASASASAALGRGRRSRSVNGAFRASSLASMALSDSVLVAPLTEAPEPQADESASGWVARRGEKAAKKAPQMASVSRSAEDRPLVRALRQAPAEAAAPVWRAVADAGLRVGSAERQVIGRALAGIETLAADEQVEVARQVVRRMKGPQRRLAEVAVEEVASAETETPARVAASRMTARANRKGLRPVLGSSPSLIGLRFEEAEVAAPAEMARRSSPVVSPKSVRARGAHAAPPVVAAAGVARTQVAVGRAGPAAAEARSSGVVARVVGSTPRRSFNSDVSTPEVRRTSTERIGARTFAASMASPAEGLDRGTAALEAPVARRSVRAAASRRAASVLSRSEFITADSATPQASETVATEGSAPIAARASASKVAAIAPRSSNSSAVATRAAVGARQVGALGPVRSAVTVDEAGAAEQVTTHGLARVAARSQSAVGRSIAAPVAGYVRVESAAPIGESRVRTERTVSRAVRPAGSAPVAVFARRADVPEVVEATPAQAGASRSPSASAAPARRVVEALAPTGRPSQRAIARAVAPDSGVVAAEPMAHARAGAVANVMQRRASAPLDAGTSAPVARAVASRSQEAGAQGAVRSAGAPVASAALRGVSRSSVLTASTPVVEGSPEATRTLAERAEVGGPVGTRRSSSVAASGSMLTALPASDTAESVEETAAPVRVPAAARAVRRAEASARVADVIAPSPVAFVARAATPKATEVEARESDSAGAPVARSASARIAARSGAVSAVEADVTAVSGLAERVSSRGAAAPAAETATGAVGRVAARADVPVAAKVARGPSDAPEAILARPVDPKVEADQAPAAAPRAGSVRPAARPASAARAIAARSGSTRHAARRMEAFAPPAVSDSAVQRAASEVVSRRASSRRAVGPALPHVSASAFRMDVEAPLGAVESRVTSGAGTAAGPVTRASLAAVLGRVAAVVRAMERSEASVALSPAIRRALADAPADLTSESVSATRVRRSRVASVGGRFERQGARSVAPFDGVFARPAEATSEASVGVAPAAPVARKFAPVVRPVARAERRASLTNAPVARPARRAMSGVSGLTGDALDHIVERSFAPAAEGGATAVRYRTLRTADGRFAPLAPEAVKPVAHRFGAGRVEIPSTNAARSYEVASGLVLPRNAVAVDAEPTAAAPVAGRATPAAARSARADRAAATPRAAARQATSDASATARPARSFTGTLGRLNGAAPVTSRGTAERASAAADRSLEGPRARRTTYDDAGVLVRAPVSVDAEAQDTVGAPLQTPGYAKRAIVGTVAETTGKRPVATHLPPRLSTGSLLTALARADRPEDVVQVILQRGGTLADVEREIPEAAAIVERIARLGGSQAARASADSVTSGAVEQAPQTRFLSHRSPSASGSRVRRSHSQAAPSEGAGSSQAMKLAQKLMNLIHLAETDRKSEDARRQVRMAEASAEARSEGSASVAAGQTKNLSGENVNIAALQREVLEAVLQALELNHHRRQEDTDVWW